MTGDIFPNWFTDQLFTGLPDWLQSQVPSTPYQTITTNHTTFDPSQFQLSPWQGTAPLPQWQQWQPPSPTPAIPFPLTPDLLLKAMAQTATPAAPSAPLPHQLGAGPFIGYRAWAIRVQPDGQMRLGALHSTGDEHAWTPGQSVAASCAGHHHMEAVASPAPAPFCLCGYYAYKRHYQLVPDVTTTVAGAVALWGRVIEHDGGWRAQFAYPVVLWPAVPLPANGPVSWPMGFPCHPVEPQLDLVKQLATIYGVRWARRPTEVTLQAPIATA